MDLVSSDDVRRIGGTFSGSITGYNSDEDCYWDIRAEKWSKNCLDQINSKANDGKGSPYSC